MRSSRLFFAVLAFAGLTAQSAAAADVMDGVTLGELEAALSVGFEVQAAEGSDGEKFFIARGQNHIIAAQLIQCGDGTRCDGVRYFSILKTAPSATIINAFNGGPNYSKIAKSDSGRTVISLDHYVGGGVTADNVLRTGAILMVAMTALGATADVVASAKPGNNTALLNFDGATARESLIKGPVGKGNFAVDPALAQAMMAHIKESTH